MIKAIEITDEILRNNPNKIFKKGVGEIEQMILPESFNGKENVLGGYSFRTDLHGPDGFMDLVIPKINPEEEKLGEPVKIGGVISYSVEKLSQEEKELIKKHLDRLSLENLIESEILNRNYEEDIS